MGYWGRGGEGDYIPLATLSPPVVPNMLLASEDIKQKQSERSPPE